MREIGPFAGERALRSLERARGFPGQEIREIEEIAGLLPALRKVALQPHQLRRLHFGRHDAADEVEHLVAGRCAFLGFGDGAVVEPDDGVPTCFAGGRDTDLAAVLAAHHQRAGGIERDAADISRRGLRLVHRRADGSAHSAPDVFRILLGVVVLRPVHCDRLFCTGKQPPATVEHARARTSGSDIYGDDKVGHAGTFNRQGSGHDSRRVCSRPPFLQGYPHKKRQRGCSCSAPSGCHARCRGRRS